MTKEEFFDALDELLRSDAGIQSYNLEDKILKLLKHYPLNDENQTYLTEYLANAQHKQLNSYQIDIFWALANSYNNTPLMDALIELNGGTITYDLLIHILECHWHTAFKYTIRLYHDDINNPYNLLYTITNYYYSDKPDYQVIEDLLTRINPRLLSKTQTSNLLYEAIAHNPEVAETLIQHGCNPFSNYWNYHNIDTGIPILFEAVQTSCGFDFIQQHNDTQEWWNTTDQWGRNLLHFATKHKDYWEYKNYYDLLVEKGVDPDHRAIPQDENIITLAKIKRQPIPPEYGKTPRELNNFPKN